MSTSDTSGLPQGWPDVETMERMANQFFVTLPVAGSPSLPAGMRGDVDLKSVLGSTPPVPVIGLPGEAELRALLGTSSSETRATSPYYFLEHAGVTPAAPAIPEFDHSNAQPSMQGFSAPFDVNLIRRDFPILQERVNRRPLIWLDNAATTQKLQAVIDRLKHFYEHENSNIHRAAHELAARATDAYEEARDKIRGFLNASSTKEIVFVRGATEAINLVAQSWGRQNIGKDDEILVTWLEHHAFHGSSWPTKRVRV